MADAPDTVFTLRHRRADATVGVYALTADEGGPPSMSKEEWEERAALNGLVEDLADLPPGPGGVVQGEPSPTRPTWLACTSPTT